ncbi:MAG: twin-arginine translocase subunit TatC [Thermoanaerobaculia bacterium]
MIDRRSGGDPEEELPRMTFFEHLEDLRRRLIWSVAAVAVGFLLCWWRSKEIFQILSAPVLKALPQGTKLAYTQLTEPFMLYINVALIAGIFVASPVILWQLWLFVAPGLYKHEKKWVLPFVGSSVFFFVGGGIFGYTVAFPMVANFLVSTGEDFTPVLKIEDYLDIVSKTLLGMGLVFETPLLIFFLARIGVVDEKWLLAKFRYAVLIIFIIAAVITPTPDIPTQTAFALPMCALYLLGVGLAWAFKKRDAKKTPSA